jgi:hypothetical protein
LKIEILKLDLDDLCVESAFPFDDPHGLCRINEKTLTAFRTNPMRQIQGGLAQLVGTVDGCVAGTLMFLPGEIFVDGKAYSVAWCSGLYVAPEFRKSLLGLTLIKEARRSYVIVGGSRVGDTAFPLFERLGWLSIPLTRYVLLCRSRPILEHSLGPGRSAAILTPLADCAFSLHRRLLKGREEVSCANLRCRPADSMPEALDAALADLSHAFGCHRSSRWLNWILQNTFDADPRNRKHVFLIHDRQDRVVAYFVTRVKFHKRPSHRGSGNLLVGSVLDWGVFDPHAVSQERIWLMATNTLTAEGVDVVEICDEAPDADLPFGFRKFGEHRMVLYSNPTGPTISRDNMSHWRVRQIDGDSGLS